MDYELSPQFNFSPIKTSVHNELLTELLSVTDSLLGAKSNKKLDYSEKLAGKIDNGNQLLVPKSLISTGFYEFVNELAQTYIDKLSGGKHTIGGMKIEAWLVSQLAHDYNPLHRHGGKMSGIIYLKMPECINESNFPDGQLYFCYGESDPDSLRFFGNRVVLPKIADVYLFPNWLNHGVYPFKGDGERRCISFNLSYTLGTK